MLARLLPNSLAMRAIVFSTIWAAISLFAITSVITALYRNAAEKNYDGLLSAHLFNLIGAVSVDDKGKLTGAPELGDLRYSIPNSGWYWEVTPATPKIAGNIRSSSMGSGVVPLWSFEKKPFDKNFKRNYETKGLDGERIDVYESEVTLGADDQIARFRVMGNLSEFDAEITDFSATLYKYLGLFGLGSIAINALAILAGLNPLKRVREALTAVREGKSQRLDGRFPQEIEPLANEMNALIDNNRRIVERSRTQVGNLAHSLKTPLSVIANEGRSLSANKGKIIGEQAQAMQTQIQHYLQRARVAAQRDSVVFRAPIEPIVERMLRVMRKLNPEKTYDLIGDYKTLVFAGEAEDFEELLGNLLENASKWGRKNILVQIERISTNFVTIISDDGPGLPDNKIQEALKRGTRLDESTPGTGLGLAIVSDIVREYGGTLHLSRSNLGGLEVKFVLPRAL